MASKAAHLARMSAHPTALDDDLVLPVERQLVLLGGFLARFHDVGLSGDDFRP